MGAFEWAMSRGSGSHSGWGVKEPEPKLEHAPASEPAPVDVGAILGEKYRIVRRLGRGGMGIVYEAHHALLERRFAVKVLRVGRLKSPDAILRFTREAQAAGRLENDHVASVIDLGTAQNGCPYLVMEYLDGRPLSRIFREDGPLSVERAVALLLQACDGIQATHAAGIVHRDLKPDNLFVVQRADGSERIKVLDFGIAKLRDATLNEGALTQTGTAMGTPRYMSPEQARGESNVDARSDVYSLGVVLYEALAGRFAYEGANYNEIIYNILTRALRPLHEFRADVPPALSYAIQRAVAKDAAFRFRTVDELARALRDALSRQEPGDRSEDASTLDGTGRAGPLPVSLENTASGVVGQARNDLRARWLGALLLACCIASVALVTRRAPTNRAQLSPVAPVGAVPARRATEGALERRVEPPGVSSSAAPGDSTGVPNAHPPPAVPSAHRAPR